MLLVNQGNTSPLGSPQVHARTRVPHGLVGWWVAGMGQYNNSNFTFMLDASGFNRQGTQQGIGVPTGVRSPGLSRGYNSNIGSGFFNPNNSAGFGMGQQFPHYNNNAYSYCCWINPTRFDTAAFQVAIGQDYGGITDPLRGILGLDNANPAHLDARMYTAGGVQRGGQGTTTFSANVWKHIGMTACSTGLRGYIDGATELSTNFSATVPTSACTLNIGNINGFPGNQLPDASLFDCRIYNRAISQAEMITIKNEAYVLETDPIAWLAPAGTGGTPGTGLLQPTTNSANMRRQVSWVAY